MSSSTASHHSDSKLKQLAELICDNENTEVLASSEWTELLGLANQHCVQALLLHNLQCNANWPSVPEIVREKLTRQNHMLCGMEIRMEQEVQHVLDALNATDIRYLLMKGTPLAYSLYSEPHQRIRGDTDILFPDHDTAERAWHILEKFGYSHSTPTSGEYVGYQFYCLREIAPGIYSNFDCHIRVNDYLIYAHAFEFDELFEASVSIPVLAESARGLGPVHALMLACMHRVASLPNVEVDRLIWMYDIYLLANSFTAKHWEDFLRHCVHKKIAGSCHPTLLRAKGLFPIEIPQEVLTGLEVAAESEPFHPNRTTKRWKFYLAGFKSVRGFRNKAKMLREHFFPPWSYMQHKYQTDNRLLLPYLYIHRVFSGLKRYF